MRWLKIGGHQWCFPVFQSDEDDSGNDSDSSEPEGKRKRITEETLEKTEREEIMGGKKV